ncbi:hypothetical protein B0H10DRAFT_778499 [Mycena sp. CBHHK59/15]|nr:hypothetical protein B0H10DRAFT_778499 [Mycena sp. CBHHK59/15]
MPPTREVTGAHVGAAEGANGDGYGMDAVEAMKAHKVREDKGVEGVAKVRAERPVNATSRITMRRSPPA